MAAMEDLTKQQIVLVALLVSFVTSIATGIVTVALMDQAPPAMTQTINRVVERTIEQVTQSPSQPAAAVATKETVVVKEDDMVVAAVQQNEKSIVRLTNANVPDAPVSALGVVLTKGGIVAVDANAVVADAAYAGHFSDGTAFPLRRVFSNETGNIALYQADLSNSGAIAFTPVSLADPGGLNLGQTVVFIGGQKDNTVATGIVSSLQHAAQTGIATTSSASTGSAPVTAIDTTVTDTDGLGGILSDLSADIVGFGVAGGVPSFLPAGVLSNALNAYLASSSPQATSTAAQAGVR